MSVEIYDFSYFMINVGIILSIDIYIFLSRYLITYFRNKANKWQINTTDFRENLRAFLDMEFSKNRFFFFYETLH